VEEVWKAGATRAHEVRTLQRTYFMTDVAEVTTRHAWIWWGIAGGRMQPAICCHETTWRQWDIHGKTDNSKNNKTTKHSERWNSSIENQRTSWRSSSSARVPRMLRSIGFFLFLQRTSRHDLERTQFMRSCGPSLSDAHLPFSIIASYLKCSSVLPLTRLFPVYSEVGDLTPTILLILG
jgi:hypothetical protein